jgi:hypothetical protein
MGVLADEFRKFCAGDDTLAPANGGDGNSEFEGLPEDSTDAHAKWTEALKLGIADFFSITNNIGIGTAGDIAGDIEKGLTDGLLVTDFGPTGELRTAVATAMFEVATKIKDGTAAGSSLMPLFPSWVSQSPDAPPLGSPAVDLLDKALHDEVPWPDDAKDLPPPPEDETRTQGEIFSDGLEAAILKFFTPGQSIGSLVILGIPVPLLWIIPAAGSGLDDPALKLENALKDPDDGLAPGAGPGAPIVLQEGEWIADAGDPQIPILDIEAVFVIVTTLLHGFRVLDGETEEISGLKPTSQTALTYLQALRDGVTWDAANEAVVHEEGGFLKMYTTSGGEPQESDGSADYPYALSDAIVTLVNDAKDD